MRKRHKQSIIFLLMVVPLAIWFAIVNIQGEKQKIRNWAADNNYEVLSVSPTLMDYGPFWYCHDEQTIYRAQLQDRYEDKKTYYFRVSFWRLEAKEQ